MSEYMKPIPNIVPSIKLVKVLMMDCEANIPIISSEVAVNSMDVKEADMNLNVSLINPINIVSKIILLKPNPI
jgi:hypothetical protein